MRNHLDSLSRHKDRLFQISLRDIVSSVGPFTILLLIFLAAAYFYIDPAPPHHIVISTGREDSEYQDYAERYKEILARDNIVLETRQSEGTPENLRRLKSETSDVEVAFVVDGLHDKQDADIYSLGSINYEPIWVFYRDRHTHNRLADFEGKKIAVGVEGSGTQILSMRLLTASGIDQSNADLIPSGREEAVELFMRNKVDVVFLMGQPDSGLIKKLLSYPGARVMDFDQFEAYARQFPFLHNLVLPHGAVDLHHNIPSTDLHLLATTSTLAVCDHLHPAIISLLMKAMTEVHEGPDLLWKEHTFPSDKDVDFEMSPDAMHYYKSGPPFLQRYMPFWLATLIDRTLLVAIPMFALLIPLSRTVPQIYRWRIKRRINRWYKELILLETQLRTGSDYHEYMRTLEWIEEQVAHVPIPLSFSEYSFVLKEHIDLVRRKILRLKNGSKDNGDLAMPVSVS